MNLDLSRRTAIVCGSTQGIGKASAIELAQLGANIILVARNKDKLKKAIKDLDGEGGQKHYTICADFDSPDVLKAQVESHIAANGPVHILVNNTGGPAGGPAIEADLEAFSRAFSSHLLCNQIMVQAVVEGMRSEGYGRIINIISTSVKAPLKGLGVSNTIRGAVANWSKTLAGELGPYNITVNNVLPGATNTMRLRSIAENKASKLGKTTEEVFKAMAGEVPLGRIAEASEVANVVAFLASPAASYVSGINVPVDGGRLGCL